ncbi:hypothetical protein CCP3SC15_1830003 [Gammaproteobacteria bacterium]
MIRSATESGVLLQAEAFQKEQRVVENQAALEIKILRERREQFQADGLERAKIDGEIAVLESKLSVQRQVSAAKITTLVRAEMDALVQYNQALRAESNQAFALTVEINKALSPGVGFDSRSKAVFDAKQRELDQLEKEKELRLLVASSINKESEETRRLSLELAGIQTQRLTDFKALLDASTQNISNPAVKAVREQQVAQAELNKQATKLAELQQKRSLTSLKTGNPEVDTALDAARHYLDIQIKATGKSISNLSAAINRPTVTLTTALKGLGSVFLGAGSIDAWKTANSRVQKFGAGVGMVTSAFANVLNAVDAFKRGLQEGGALGGIGALGQQVGGSLSQIPGLELAGGIVSSVGQVFSFVGNLFMAAAKRIGEDIKKSFQKTLDNYQSGNTTLVETLAILERERTDAIIRLSGKKGGKGELDQILPEFDREISSLKQQQRDIITNFETELRLLNLQSDALAETAKQWADINKQVKEYINAGGDATNAATFLSKQLESIKNAAISELASAEQEAIGDAIKLNDLLDQRNQLVSDFRKQEFDLINGGAIERQQAASVTKGKELDDLRKKNAEQLAQLDQEITRQTTRVAKEREVFNLASDIAALKRRDEEMTMNALEAQINKWKDLKSIAASIFMGEDGLFRGVGTIFQVGSVQVTVSGISGNPQEIGSGIADSMLTEFARQSRLRLA